MSGIAVKGGGARGVTRLRVDASDPIFADAVLTDLTRVAMTLSGRTLIECIRTAGRTVTIKRAVPPLDPPNAWTRPDDLKAATAAGKAIGQSDKTGNPILGSGAGSDTIITYQPTDWPSQTDPRSRSSDVLLYQMMHQANDQMRGIQDLSSTPPGEISASESGSVVQYEKERAAVTPAPPDTRP